jgi:tripartite-type tricarboxylate transporter receptor subunit TctC
MRLSIRRLAVALGLVLLEAAPIAIGAQQESARAPQDYPARPIRIIVPFTAGSASDFFARLLGPKLVESWGQQVVVDNRPSAGGIVAGDIVARAAPDGHTLMLTSSAFAGSAALYSKLPYDSIKDFSGVTQIASNPNMLVVAPGLGVKTLKELIALARQKPGQLNFGSAGIGSGIHYSMELFNLAAGIKAVHVPFRGSPEVVTETAAGRLHYSFVPMPPSIPFVKSGRLLGLAVTTATRSHMLPDVPTIAEAAIPGFEYDGWFGLFAPSATPRGIVNQLAAETARILALPDVREPMLNQGATPKSSTPQALDSLVRTEIQTRRKVFAAAGTRVE